MLSPLGVLFSWINPLGILESESSSMSSEDDETESDDDAGSIDSADYTKGMRLDENVCPKDCDRKLYDYTFELRHQR